MSRRVTIDLTVSAALFVVAFLVIKALGLDLPRSKSLSEFINRIFWIYPETIDRSRITRNRVAWLIAVIAVYLVMTTIYRRAAVSKVIWCKCLHQSGQRIRQPPRQ